MRSITAAAAALILCSTQAAAQHALAAGGPYDPSVPTPASVLGYEVGERFTPHHMLMRYLDRVAAASPRVRLDTVAHTFEGREVMLVVVTSEANQGRLGEIRAGAARLADPRGVPAGEMDALVRRMPTIAWMGFTVHGPEASGAEAAIALVYQLAAGQDAGTRMVLDSAVVLIDPLQNPDGHERHVQDVMRMRTALGVPVHPQARIHSGTWPGPRTSHYHFDMNRDWYAQSHPETRGRVSSMLEWWPHVAADLHEMGSNSTYFFPPPMAPVNALVQPDIVRWWDVFARANMAAFDANGWSYFRREGYDEFYPGYGSSWPIYGGAVGMTYEQASSRGGAIRRADGTVLTLSQAARQHYAAAWATVTTAARNARARVRDYAAFRQSAVSDADRAPFRAVAFARDSGGRADSLAQSLRRNGIEVHRLREAANVGGATEYGGAARGNASLPAGTYVVDFAQPQGRLARVLLETDAPLDSSFIAEELERRRVGMSERFYDMTAWSLPFTHRVRAWGLRTPPSGLEPVGAPAAP
ncbi:MAG TPA: M14 family zinc carboxypeptidase, partial [Gemmatimonadales bacterium]